MVAYSLKSIVLMMKPSVGLTVVTSSFMIFLTIVVLPALSRPLEYPVGTIPHAGSISMSYSNSILISLSFKRAFRSIDNIIGGDVLGNAMSGGGGKLRSQALARHQLIMWFHRCSTCTGSSRVT